MKKEYTFEDYIQDALRTESTLEPLTEAVVKRGLTNRILHAIIGLVTEEEEYVLALNNNDEVNALEELGDTMWYIAILVDEVFYSKNENMTEWSIKENIAIPESPTEMLDICKKVMFYGKTLDIDLVRTFSLAHLAGINTLIRTHNAIPEIVCKTNIAKLKARYPEKFTEKDAENRDLDTERKILETGLSDD